LLALDMLSPDSHFALAPAALGPVFCLFSALAYAPIDTRWARMLLAG
jgi:hypothetical protein